MVYGKRTFFCWEELENSSVILSNFCCKDTKFILNATQVWCNTENIGKKALPEVNEIYDNIDAENPMYWEIEFNPLQEVISMETDWSKAKLASGS